MSKSTDPKVAALAAAFAKAGEYTSEGHGHPPRVQHQMWVVGATHSIPAILAALDGWTLVPSNSAMLATVLAGERATARVPLEAEIGGRSPRLADPKPRAAHCGGDMVKEGHVVVLFFVLGVIVALLGTEVWLLWRLVSA